MNIIIIAFCLLLSAEIVAADSFSQALQFFAQKNYPEAKKIWAPLALQGDVRAQYNMALILSHEEVSVKNQKIHPNAEEYLQMTYASGLVDSYLYKIPVRQKNKHVATQRQSINNTQIDPLNWLKQQQSTHYTLQLATGKSRSSMHQVQKKLLASQVLGQAENLYIQEVKAKEKDKASSYLLLYGVYASYQQAKDEVAQLPQAILKSSPWIRQFGVLQSKVAVQQPIEKTADTKE